MTNQQNKQNIKSAIDSLINGNIGVMASDTIYGLFCCALNKNSVKKLYRLKERTPSKPFIVLISKLSDLDYFGVKLNDFAIKVLNQSWPGPVSIILNCPEKSLKYLHQGHKSLAFRLPNKKSLIDLINKTGPLVSTSANPEGLEPAKDMKQAMAYFGDRVDFYLDEGPLIAKPSRIIKITNDKITIIRD